MVFDDWFTSIISTDSDKPYNLMQWAQLFTDAHYQYGLDDDDPIILANDWIVFYLKIISIALHGSNFNLMMIFHNRGRD